MKLKLKKIRAAINTTIRFKFSKQKECWMIHITQFSPNQHSDFTPLGKQHLSNYPDICK